MRQTLGQAIWTKKRQLAITLALMGFLMSVQTLSPFALAGSSLLVDQYAVQVGQVVSFNWYRVGPFQFPNTVEYCTASTNPSYIQISLYPTGPFSGTIANVPFPADPSGYGNTPTVYARGIAVASDQTISLICPYTTGHAAIFDVVSPPQTPTPTPTPTMTIEAPNGAEQYLALNAFKGFKAVLSGFPVASSGTLTVSESSQDFVFDTQNISCCASPLSVNNVQFDSAGEAEVSFLAKAVKASGSAKQIVVKFYPSSGATLTKTISLTAVNVQSVWFERDAGQIPIDNNPHVGGGLRIFPEKKTPTDTSFGRNKVVVKAKTFPAITGLKVDFRIYDVDDPEFVSPEDPTGALDLDDNGIGPNDNRGATTFNGTADMYISSYTNSSGIATAFVKVSPQPGDNIRVAAIVDGETYTNHTLGAIGNISIGFDDVDITLPSGTVTQARIGLKDVNGNIITETGGNTSVAVATKMLTTWRRLHLEVDSMAKVANNFLSGEITNTTPFPIGTGTTLTTDKTFENNRYQNGRIEILKDGVTTSHKIVSSTRISINVSAVLTDTLIGSSVKLFDDDDMNGNDLTKLDGDNGEDVPSPDLGWLQDVDHFTDNALMIVYIRPTYDLTGNDANLPFYLNALKADLSAEDSTIDEKTIMTRFNNETTRHDAEFWTGYLLGAYQSFVQGDSDPVNEAETNNVDGFVAESHADFGSICYLEKISDQTGHKNLQYGDTGYDPFFDWREAPRHEVLHQLRAVDGDGGQIDNQYYGLSGLTQHRIRTSLVPYMADAP